MQRQLTPIELEADLHATIADINILRNKHNQIISVMMVSVFVSGAIRFLLVNQDAPFHDYYKNQCLEIIYGFDNLKNDLDDMHARTMNDFSDPGDLSPEFIEKGDSILAQFKRAGMDLSDEAWRVTYAKIIERFRVACQKDPMECLKIISGPQPILQYLQDTIPDLKHVQFQVIQKPIHLFFLLGIGLSTYFINSLRILLWKSQKIEYPIAFLSETAKRKLATTLKQQLRIEKKRDKKISISVMFSTTCLFLPIICMEFLPAEMIALLGMLLIPFIHYLQKEAKQWHRHKNKRFIIDAFTKALQININDQDIYVERLRHHGAERLSLTSFMQINFKDHNEADKKNLKRALKHYLDHKPLHYSCDENNNFIITIDDDLLMMPGMFSDFNKKMQHYFNQIQTLDGIVAALHQHCPNYSFMESFSFSPKDSVSCKFFMRMKSKTEINFLDNDRLQVTKLEENESYTFISIELFGAANSDEKTYLAKLAKNISQPVQLSFDGTLAKGHARTAAKKRAHEKKDSKEEASSGEDNNDEVKIIWPSGIVFVGSLKSPQYTDTQGRQIFEIRSDHAPRFSFFGVLPRPITELTNDEELQHQMESILEDPKEVAAVNRRGFVNDDGTFKWKFLGHHFGDTRVECSDKEKASKQERNGKEEKNRNMPLFHYAGDPVVNKYHKELKRR